MHAMHPDSARPYLGACTIYRNNAEYLAEWIEVHRLIGFERFFLYDNGSTDDHLDVLAPYVEEGLATVHEWPMPFLGRQGRVGAIIQAFEHCLGEHRDDARWIAFLDLDEFMFSPTGRPLTELLPEYEEFPGVGVGRAEFGPSGHVTRPEGLVIENYTRRQRVRPDARGPIKTVLDPTRAVRCLGAHHFVYREGVPVDEHKRPIVDAGRTAVIPISFDRFQVNHYWAKSREEMQRKHALWRETGSIRAQADFVRDSAYPVADEALAAYAPAAREAIEQRLSPRR
jgi:Glycosyltransferase family 92